MTTITFITRDDETIIAKGNSGSVMELAVQYKVKGIDGDCGGVCSCATCHVHLSPEDMHKVEPMPDFEKYTLEFEDNVTEYSRLSCQLKVCDKIDGIVLRVVN